MILPIKTHEELKQENDELRHLVSVSSKAINIVIDTIGINNYEGFNFFSIAPKIPRLMDKVKKDPTLFAFLSDEKFQTLLKKYGNTNNYE